MSYCTRFQALATTMCSILSLVIFYEKVLSGVISRCLFLYLVRDVEFPSEVKVFLADMGSESNLIALATMLQASTKKVRVLNTQTTM